MVLGGLSDRRAARMVGICKTEVGDSLDLLLGELAALGLCQPDGTFVATLQDLRERLAEMTEVGAHLPRPMDPPHPDMKKHTDTLTDQLVDNAVSRVGPTATVTVVTGPIALVALAAPGVRPASARAR